MSDDPSDRWEDVPGEDADATGTTGSAADGGVAADATTTDADPAHDADPTPDDPLLRVEGLSTRFFTQEGQVNAVEDVSFTVGRGEAFGVVGESGSGKSVMALSLVDLVESPGRVTAGRIWLHDAALAEEFRESRPEAVDGDAVDVRSLPDRVRRSLRGRTFAMIFQDPMSSFNPSLTVGEQIAEAVEVQRRASDTPRSTRSRTQGFGLAKFVASLALPGRSYVGEESRSRAIELLEQVGIPDPAQRADQYPHEFSGGMLQRAMIAQALAGEPDLLIADEPTTALDVTIQAQILELIDDLRTDREMSVLTITHNLGVIARTCSRVGVMYAGEIVERGTLRQVFEEPVHPYTQGLIGSIPDIEDPAPRLQPIAGNVPDLIDEEMDDRCYFADRCPKAMRECLTKPPEFDVDPGHGAKCYLAEHSYEQGDPLPEEYFDDPAGADGVEGTGRATDGGHGDGTREDGGSGRRDGGAGRPTRTADRRSTDDGDSGDGDASDPRGGRRE